MPQEKQSGAVGYVMDAAKGLGQKITNADAIADLTKRVVEQEAHMTRVKGTIRNTALIGGGAAAGTAVGGAAVHLSKHKEAAAEAIDGYSLAIFAGFSDEMQKIAGKASDAIKGFGHLLAGGARKDLVHTTDIPQGRIARAFGMKPKSMTTILEGAGPRVGSGIEAIQNPATRSEALKVLGARGAAGTAAVGTGAVASKHHKEQSNQRLGRAYMAGARDMYAQSAE